MWLPGVNFDRRGGRGHFQERDFLLGTARGDRERTKNKTATGTRRG